MFKTNQITTLIFTFLFQTPKQDILFMKSHKKTWKGKKRWNQNIYPEQFGHEIVQPIMLYLLFFTWTLFQEKLLRMSSIKENKVRLIPMVKWSTFSINKVKY